jgi:hypothetical protein
LSFGGTMAGAFFGFGCEHYIEDEHLHHRHKHIVLLTLRSLATYFCSCTCELSILDLTFRGWLAG